MLYEQQVIAAVSFQVNSEEAAMTKQTRVTNILQSVHWIYCVLD